MPYKDRQKQNDYNLRFIRKRREAWFAANGPCDCGSTLKLEVHHMDPSKKVSHRIWTWSEERRSAELAKCCVKCAKCHDKLHGELWKKHDIRRYDAHGCRCEICKAAKSAKNAKRPTTERERRARSSKAERHLGMVDDVSSNLIVPSIN